MKKAFLAMVTASTLFAITAPTFAASMPDPPVILTTAPTATYEPGPLPISITEPEPLAVQPNDIDPIPPMYVAPAGEADPIPPM